MSGSINFSDGDKRYEVFLKAKETKNSVSIGGKKYSVKGEKQAVELFKEKIKEMHLEQTKFADWNKLQKRFYKIAKEGQKAVEEGIILTFPTNGRPNVSIIDRMNQMGIKGVSVAVVNGKERWSAGYGEFEKPVLIQAASISKTVTAMTVMALIDQKFFSLETNIKDILDAKLWDSISNGRETVTIAQLMSHTAGLEEETQTGFRGYREEDEIPNLDQILKGKNTNSPPVKVTGIPGKSYAYSGGGAMILQKVIEKVTGRQFHEVVEENVFNKLKMNDSHFNLNEKQKENTAQGYDRDGNPMSEKWMIQPELAAAGLWTTAEDLLKLAIGIQVSLKSDSKENVISQTRAQAMIRPVFEKEISDLNDELEHLKTDEDRERIQEIEDKLRNQPGLGLFIDPKKDTTYFFHDGSNLGFNCLMVANDKDQAAVVMTNSDFGNELYPEIVRKIADVYKWEGKESLRMFPSLHPEVLKAEAINPEDWLNKYEGQYQNMDPDRATVFLHLKQQDKKINLITPDDETFEFFPLSNHLGVFQRNNIGPWIPIEFKKGEQGAIIIHLNRRKYKKLNKKIAIVEKSS